jgi:hypothetical protein
MSNTPPLPADLQAMRTELTTAAGQTITRRRRAARTGALAVTAVLAVSGTAVAATVTDIIDFGGGTTGTATYHEDGSADVELRTPDGDAATINMTPPPGETVTAEDLKKAITVTPAP